MPSLTVYSSAPVGLQLVCAFQNLKSLGWEVVVQPLSALPPAESPPRRGTFLLEELEQVTQLLAAIGQALTESEEGRCVLDAGLEQGLRFERDGLQSRQRALLAARRAQQGGQADG